MTTSSPPLSSPSLLSDSPSLRVPSAELDAFLHQALLEDMPQGDITTDTLFNAPEKADRLVQGVIRSQQPLVVSGLTVAQRVFQLCDERIDVVCELDNGDCVAPNTVLLSLKGPVASILKAERLALNLLQHLCGIATLTYQYTSTVSQTSAKIAHTRKTLPGLRALETQAVVDGGGIRHRQSLSEFVMLKDNHIAAAGGDIRQAVATIREQLTTSGATCKIEVECDSLAQVEAALEAEVDIILLDNMSLDNLRHAVKRIKKQTPKTVVEASGGVTLKTVRQIAETGIDVISTSQITLSAPAADIHLELN